MTHKSLPGEVCPVAIDDAATVRLAHGGGGSLTHRLIDDIFRPAFADPELDRGHDGALISAAGARLAFTTDSYVVRPLFFPGGNIGDLAVHGTINDLAMCGARALFLSAGFILEEGVAIEQVRTIAHTMGAAARAAGVRLVTGDTKVVDRGRGDGVYVNTSGIGELVSGANIDPARAAPGDAIVVSGDVGRHGIAVMARREGLEFETTIESDVACVATSALALLAAGIDVHVMRDLTRGGLATALVEIARQAQIGVQLDETAVPVDGQVAAACELLGLDPFYVACEGRFLAILPDAQVPRALKVLALHPVSASARCVGRIVDAPRATVIGRTSIGTTRVLDMLSGEQLPRIC